MTMRETTQPVLSVGLALRKRPLGRAASNKVTAIGKKTRRTMSQLAKDHSDDEAEDNAASAVSWASVEEMGVGESCLKRGRCDGKENQENRVNERRGPQGEWRLSLKAKSGQETSAPTCSEWWNKKGDDNDVRHGREVLQSAVDKTPGASSKGKCPRRHQEEKMRRNTPNRPVPGSGNSCSNPRHNMTARAAARPGERPTWRRGKEGEPRGERWRPMCWSKATLKREGPPAPSFLRLLRHGSETVVSEGEPASRCRLPPPARVGRVTNQLVLTCLA
ncbi:hypothetical protein MRX96_052257 [Rhipicephalus microplus]